MHLSRDVSNAGGVWEPRQDGASAEVLQSPRRFRPASVGGHKGSGGAVTREFPRGVLEFPAGCSRPQKPRLGTLVGALYLCMAKAHAYLCLWFSCVDGEVTTSCSS